MKNYRYPGVLSYYNRRVLLTDINALITETRWSRLWQRVRDRLHIWWCGLVTGHLILPQRWHREGDFKDGEWHVGCQRCPLFWVEP
jgi:hypothetical protein